MRFVTLLTIAAAALACSPAYAGNGNGNNGNGNGNQPNATAGFNFGAGQGFNFDGAGNATGSSASGFQMDVQFKNPSIAAFGSIGAASSDVTVTPFSVDTNSSHAGAFAGFTAGGAKLDGQVMNFGQSEGSVSFDASAYQFAGFEGFGSFND